MKISKILLFALGFLLNVSAESAQIVQIVTHCNVLATTGPRSGDYLGVNVCPSISDFDRNNKYYDGFEVSRFAHIGSDRLFNAQSDVKITNSMHLGVEASVSTMQGAANYPVGSYLSGYASANVATFTPFIVDSALPHGSPVNVPYSFTANFSYFTNPGNAGRYSFDVFAGLYEVEDSGALVQLSYVRDCVSNFVSICSPVPAAGAGSQNIRLSGSNHLLVGHRYQFFLSATSTVDTISQIDVGCGTCGSYVLISSLNSTQGFATPPAGVRLVGNDGQLLPSEISAVPELATCWFMAAGLLVSFLTFRRRGFN